METKNKIWNWIKKNKTALIGAAVATGTLVIGYTIATLTNKPADVQMIETGNEYVPMETVDVTPTEVVE